MVLIRNSNAPLQSHERYYEQWKEGGKTPRDAGWSFPMSESILRFGIIFTPPRDYTYAVLGEKEGGPCDRPSIPSAFA